MKIAADGSVWDDIRNGWDRAGETVGGVRDAVTGAADTVSGAASFASDPLGTIFEKVKDAAHALSETVLPAVFEATQPDLSMEWFLSAYAVSYGVAVFLWVVNLLWTIMQSSLGVYSSEDVLDVLTTKAAMFFGLSTFGPMAGWVVLKFFGALSDAIAQWAVNSTAEETVDAIAEMVAATDVAGMVGGVVMALVLMAAMLAGLILVIFMLVLTMVTVYLGGAVAPLAFAWYGNPVHQQLATRLLIVLAGVIAAKPLLFFVLGLAYRMGAGSVTWLDGSRDLQGIANFGAAVIALALAGLTPFLLFRFAPVTPTTAGQVGPSLHSSGSQDQDSDGGKQQSQTQKRSSENAQRGQDSDATDADSTEPSGDGANSAGGGTGGGAGGGSGGGAVGADGTSENSTGAIQQALETKKSAAEDGDSESLTSGEEDAASSTEGSDSPVGAEAKGAGDGGDAGLGGAEAAGGEAAAGESAAASGGGAGSSGAAGAAGAVTGGVALAGAAAYMAARKTAEVSADAGDTAAAEMDEGDG